MPETVKQLQERRAPIGVSIRQMADKINDEKRDFTAEERTGWEKANADFDQLTRSIEVARRSEEVGAELESRREKPPGTEDRTAKPKRTADERAEATEEVCALALQAWCRRQHGLELTPEQRRACKRTGMNPNRRAINFDLPGRPGATGKRALSGTVGASGAFTVPRSFVNGLDKGLKDFNGVRQVADVMRTDDGRDMPWPTVNDTANKGRRIGENTAAANLDPPFGVVNFGSYLYTSDIILIPVGLLEDSAFALAEEVGPMLGERLGRIQEEEDTLGTGNGMPQGIAIAAATGKTAASATAIAADELLDLIHSVDPAYRRDPSFALMMHDLVLSVVRKLKDSQNRYLFEEGQNGAPDKIKGVRYVINQNMTSTIASGAKSILAGAFRHYKVRDVKQVRFRRLEERFAELDQVGFLAHMRHDARLLNAGTNPVKALVH
ncbi:MAG TPA: phage major capsid protein [Urbifossiella sp.]|nr:phage major capsid protein [Urbifossiella sp.]